MRIRHYAGTVQLFFLLAAVCALSAFMLTGCDRSRDDLPVVPPATHPLQRDYIGFGVVNETFTHVLDEPGANGVSEGYLRRGTVVRVIERRQINNRGRLASWVLAEGNYREGGAATQGWLEEATLEIYDSEERADTASKTMIQ